MRLLRLLETLKCNIQTASIFPPTSLSPYLSPYTLWRFLLGLPPGVTSLVLPASSNSFSRALLNEFASIGSAPGVPLARPRFVLFSATAFLSGLRFSPMGGVTLRGGVATGGMFSYLVVILAVECDRSELRISSLTPMMAMAGRSCMIVHTSLKLSMRKLWWAKLSIRDLQGFEVFGSAIDFALNSRGCRRRWLFGVLTVALPPAIANCDW